MLGIDLDKRGHEVAKLLYAGFGRKLYSAGYDADDVLQEVYRGILARNNGISAWNPEISSFGHYVHMVCGCIVSNYHRKQKRDAEFIQVGVFDPEGSTVDASAEAVSDKCFDDETQVEVRELSQDLLDFMKTCPLGTGREATLAKKVLPLLVQGFSRLEISEQLGYPLPLMAKVMDYIYKAGRMWQECCKENKVQNYKDCDVLDLFG